MTENSHIHSPATAMMAKSLANSKHIHGDRRGG